MAEQRAPGSAAAQTRRAVELQARLAAELRALEAAHPALRSAPPQPPPGMRYLIAPGKALVEAPEMLRIAFARWLCWRVVLTRQIPTVANARRVTGRIRGLIFWHLAWQRFQRGDPLPTHHTPPSFALAAPPALSPPTTRAGGGGDAIDWWNAQGDSSLITPAELVGPDGVITQRTVAQLVSDGVVLPEVLASNANLMTDLQVMQLLDAAWSGQTSLWAGGAVFSEAGISSAFDIVDHYFLDFLRQQGGTMVAGIGRVTQHHLAESLYTYLGGAEGVAPQSMGALSRSIHDWQKLLGRGLASMSSERAFVIAVTETARAESFGTFAGLWMTGARKKVWMTTAGACKFCLTNEEEGPIALTESFPSGAVAPPAHPICRCAISAYVDDTWNADEWASRDPSVLDGLLFNSSLGSWPNVDLPGVSDEFLLGQMPSITRALPLPQRPADHGLLDFARLPEALQRQLTTQTLADLGQAFMAAADAAADTWRAALHMRLPRSEAELRHLGARLTADAVPPADAVPHAALAEADAQYLQTLRAAVRQALERLQPGTAHREGTPS